MSVKVIDVSHWNSMLQLSNHTDADACICKATEGRSYKDPLFSERVDWARKNGMLVGAYHYARPDKANSPQVEARHFVEEISKVVELRSSKCLMALDWEGKSISYNVRWAYDWLDSVYAMTGVRPLIYTNYEGVKKMDTVWPEILKEYGLWYASPSKSPFKYNHQPPVRVVTMHQYDVINGVDVNAFNGTHEQLEKYATPQVLEKPDGSTDEPDVTEHTCTCFMCEDIRRLIREEMEEMKQDK